MAFTSTQTVRKMKATNKGLNVRLARRLRALAEMLEKKSRDEFSRAEISIIAKRPRRYNCATPYQCLRQKRNAGLE